MDPRIDDVIKFWFEDNSYEQWFKKDPGFDAKIRERFLALHEEAAAGSLDAWPATARRSLALIVLLDQFPRNMFRDSARSFATDPAALAIAKDLLATGRAAELPLMQRMIAIIPHEHSEKLDDQNASVALYEALASGAKGDEAKMLDGAFQYAKKHREIIERFGRFPHRNALLGRESTPDEVAYLATPGAGF